MTVLKNTIISIKLCSRIVMFTSNTLLVRGLNLEFRRDDQIGDWRGYILHNFFKILNIYNTRSVNDAYFLHVSSRSFFQHVCKSIMTNINKYVISSRMYHRDVFTGQFHSVCVYVCVYVAPCPFYSSCRGHRAGHEKNGYVTDRRWRRQSLMRSPRRSWPRKSRFPLSFERGYKTQ